MAIPSGHSKGFSDFDKYDPNIQKTLKEEEANRLEKEKATGRLQETSNRAKGAEAVGNAILQVPKEPKK